MSCPAEPHREAPGLVRGQEPWESRARAFISTVGERLGGATPCWAESKPQRLRLVDGEFIIWLLCSSENVAIMQIKQLWPLV